MPSGYKFPIRDSSGTATTTSVDFEDMFVKQETFGGDGQGKLWVWGNQGALDSFTSRSSPVQVGTLTNWRTVSTASAGIAIKNDGTLWVWGNNQYGGLGVGDDVNRSSPVQVGNLSTWKAVSGSDKVNFALRSDGTLWGMGLGINGELGNGTTSSRSSPTQVGSGTNWRYIFSGLDGSATAAITNDNQLWTWGGNSFGTLGLGNSGGATARSTPERVGALSNWKQVCVTAYSMYAVKTDGTLWSWGYNFYGELGLSDTSNRSSPTQIGTLTNWKFVAPSMDNGAFAIKTDGTLWSWGANTYGDLGLGDTVHRSSPVQVGSLTDWKYIQSGLAIKTNGTLWAWGKNSVQGVLGLGDLAHRSSPTQVGGLTNWKLVSSRASANGYAAAISY